MEKNTAGKWIVFAFGDPDNATPGEPITGDAANITANIRIDGGAANAVDDTNPTELEDGYYVFDITAAEANGDLLSMHPASSTANVIVIGVPGAVWTRPANFNDLSISATTGRTDIASIEGSDATDQINAACDTALSDMFTSSAQLVDDIWDEVNTTGAHNVTNSTGKQLREGTAAVSITSGTCQATGQTTTNVRIAASESGTDDIYRFKRISFSAGTNAQFDAIITSYDGTNKDCTISPALPVPCDNTTEYDISAGIAHAETGKGGYEGGAVWVGPSGSTGTELYVDGTIDNPIDDGSFANAITVASALGKSVFHLLPGSDVTLASTLNNYEFTGAGYSVHFGGQDIGGCRFLGGAVDGIGTGSSRIVIRDCVVSATATTDLPSFAMLGCRIANDITLNGAGSYFLDQCFSGIAGTSTPSIDLESRATAANINLSLRHYSGGIELQNVGTGAGTPTDNISLEGNGQLVINANCTAGTVAIRGNFTVTDNAGGALTLSDDARVDAAQILDAVTDDATKIDGSAVNAIAADWTNGGRLDLLLDALQVEVEKLTTTAHSEPTGVPAANEAPIDKIGYLFMALRNQVDVTATKKTFYDDGGVAEWEKDLSDDGTTYSESEGNAI